jgi:alanine racemase
MTRPARVVIDLPAIAANLDRVRGYAPGRRIMAVVKADAYGHGLRRAARALTAADAFGVACLEEAAELRESGVRQPIVLLEGAFSAAELPEIRRLRLETVVHQHEQLRALEALPPGPPIPVWLKVDSGMHRLGFGCESVRDARARLRACPQVAPHVRLMTHLASAHVSGERSTLDQIARFAEAIDGLPGERSIANSAAILAIASSHADWIRPGLALYGVSPFEGRTGADEGLRPAMTLESALISVRRVGPGEAVGYAAAWRCPEAMPIGIVGIGYGDGYPRHAGSGTPVLVSGRRVQVIGHPSMDMLCVDLRAIPDAAIGDRVVLWGEGLPIEEVAKHAGTVPYELLCSVRMRARFGERG